MNALFSGDLKILFFIAGGLILVIVAVMSILLPILVYKIMGEIAETNRKLGRIVTLLGELGSEGERGSFRDPGRLGGDKRPSRGEPGDIGEKPLRFK